MITRLRGKSREAHDAEGTQYGSGSLPRPPGKSCSFCSATSGWAMSRRRRLERTLARGDHNPTATLSFDPVTATDSRAAALRETVATLSPIARWELYTLMRIGQGHLAAKKWHRGLFRSRNARRGDDHRCHRRGSRPARPPHERPLRSQALSVTGATMGLEQGNDQNAKTAGFDGYLTGRIAPGPVRLYRRHASRAGRCIWSARSRSQRVPLSSRWFRIALAAARLWRRRRRSVAAHRRGAHQTPVYLGSVPLGERNPLVPATTLACLSPRMDACFAAHGKQRTR
jgi:hypothetical protein